LAVKGGTYETAANTGEFKEQDLPIQILRDGFAPSSSTDNLKTLGIVLEMLRLTDS
jgi:hypothetical protein